MQKCQSMACKMHQAWFSFWTSMHMLQNQRGERERENMHISDEHKPLPLKVSLIVHLVDPIYEQLPVAAITHENVSLSQTYWYHCTNNLFFTFSINIHIIINSTKYSKVISIWPFFVGTIHLLQSLWNNIFIYYIHGLHSAGACLSAIYYLNIDG